MVYTEVDQLAVNTIRVLAVCFFHLFCPAPSALRPCWYQRFLGETPSANRTPGREVKTPYFLPGVYGYGVIGERAFDCCTVYTAQQLWRDGSVTIIVVIFGQC